MSKPQKTAAERLARATNFETLNESQLRKELLAYLGDGTNRDFDQLDEKQFARIARLKAEAAAEAASTSGAA